MNDTVSLLKATNFRLKFQHRQSIISIIQFSTTIFDAHLSRSHLWLLILIIPLLLYSIYKHTLSQSCCVLCVQQTTSNWKAYCLSLTCPVSMPFRHVTTTEVRHWWLAIYAVTNKDTRSSFDSRAAVLSKTEIWMHSVVKKKNRRYESHNILWN